MTALAASAVTGATAAAAAVAAAAAAEEAAAVEAAADQTTHHMSEALEDAPEQAGEEVVEVLVELVGANKSETMDMMATKAQAITQAERLEIEEMQTTPSIPGQRMALKEIQN
jgi:hypothetical protein